MTTGSGKKTSKTGKTPASRSRRKKVVDKAPAPAEIDKQKMAAFFSAAGLDNSASDSVKEPDKVDVKKSEKTALKDSGESLVTEPPASSVKESGPLDQPEPVTADLKKGETAIVVDPVDGAAAGSENSDIDKGETAMTKTPPAAGGGSDSFSILSMVFVLAVLALFWFYYISSAPLNKAAVVQLEQGKAEISALMSKINGLEAEVARLRAKLTAFEKAAENLKKAAAEMSPLVMKKVVVPEKKALEKKVAVKAAPKDGQAPSAIVKKDSSFDKAPVPFWRQMKRGHLAQKPLKKVKPVIKTPAVKGDSFSKAPKPFWLTPRVKPGVAKVKKEVKISAPPTMKAVSKPKKITAKPEPVLVPALDPSFKKAPRPFWLKD